MVLQKINQLTLSVFFTPDGLLDMKEKGHRRRVTEFLKYLEIDKVYLAMAGEGFIGSPTVREIKTHFEEKGFIVSGGQIPLRYRKGMYAEQIDYAGRKLGKPCLSDPRNRKPIIQSFTDVAKLFDEYILDDHFYLDCYCDRCIELFNQKYNHDVTRESLTRMIFNSEQRFKIVGDFIRFREDQLMDCIENLCVKPSCKVNPKVRMVFKVAEWYERFRFRGMNMPKVSKHFNQICVGTESRDLTERYGSYFLIRYNKSLCGEKKVDRAWIDDLGGYNYFMPIESGGYADIARCSVLVGIQELILWCYPMIFQPDRQPVMRKFKTILPELREIHRITQKTKPHCLPVAASDNPRTVFSAETYIFDLLGGLGIPLEPVKPRRPDKSIKNLLFPVHGIQEENKKNVIDYVNKGGYLLLTSESARLLARNVWGKEGLNLLGITTESAGVGSERTAQVTAFASAKDKEILYPINHRRCSTAPVRPVFVLGKAKPILLGLSEETYIPVVYENQVGKGKVLVFCLTAFPPYLKNYYPENVRDCLRENVFERIGVRTKALGYASTSIGNFMESGYQDSIALFPFADGHIAILNLHHVSFETEVHIGRIFKKTKKLQTLSLLTGKRYLVETRKDRHVIKVRLEPHQLELIKII